MLNAEKQSDIGLLVLRISVALLILLHGFGNLLSGYAFIRGVLEGIGLPQFFAYGVFLGEIVAPVFILIGFRARLASAVLAFNMLVAILMVHAADIFALNQFGGWAVELQGLYLFGAVAIYFTGAGNKALSSSHRWD